MAPKGLLNRLKEYYNGTGKQTPAIAWQAAAGLSILYTLLYVLPLYLSAASRPSPQLSRDAPSVIRARIRAVTVACVVSSLATLYVIVTWGKATPWEALRLQGYWPISPSAILKSFSLTALLFAGPLFERGIAEGGWREWTRRRRLGEVVGSWIGWRNYIAGPITEEIVFRSTMTPLHLLAKVAPKYIIFLTPLYFGIAHIHHFYEYTLTHPHTPLPPALLRALVQFAYTSVFGFYATFLYLRTGSLPAVILAHSFCNLCGLPRLWGRLDAGAALGPPAHERGDEDRKDDDHDDDSARVARLQVSDARDKPLALPWTVAYYVLLVGGAVGFWKGLWVLTESERGLVGF